MGYFSMRFRIAIGILLVLTTISASGCSGLLVTAMYMIKGNNVDPDFAGLKGKKVAVVCRPLVSLQYGNANVARELSKQVSALLQKNVPKIKVIDDRKVAKWTDENTWEEYTEVGKALKADYVVGVDLEAFSIFQGQTLYQGKANVTIHVYDCQNGGEEVFVKALPQIVYPPNTGIPTSDRLEAEFRREFVAVVADHIGRRFYEHDRYADMVQDTAAAR